MLYIRNCCWSIQRRIPMINTQKIDYKQAGVDIDAGNKVVQSISSLVAQTARLGAQPKLGSFGGLFDLKELGYHDPLLVSSTDGVGTKLKLATLLNKHNTVGQDLVAMCVNDIVAQGAEPLFFLDYFATSKLTPHQATEVISGIARGCKLCNCALIGGETAEMPGMYKDNEYDLAGFVVGIVERTHVLPKKDEMKAGDVIIGLSSSGPHSNGYSLIRKLIELHNIPLDQPAPFATQHKTLGDALLEPTYIYSSALLPLSKQQLLKGIAHITGGGLIENIPRILPVHLAAELDATSWKIPPVFTWLQQLANLDDHEMQRTFNMGIGMILIVDVALVDQVLTHLTTTEFKAQAIGKLTDSADKQGVIK